MKPIYYDNHTGQATTLTELVTKIVMAEPGLTSSRIHLRIQHRMGGPTMPKANSVANILHRLCDRLKIRRVKGSKYKYYPIS